MKGMNRRESSSPREGSAEWRVYKCERDDLPVDVREHEHQVGGDQQPNGSRATVDREGGLIPSALPSVDPGGAGQLQMHQINRFHS